MRHRSIETAWPLVAGKQMKVSVVPSAQIKSAKVKVTWRNTHKSLGAFIFPTSIQKEGEINSESVASPAWVIAGHFQWAKSSTVFIQCWNVVREQGIGWLPELWNKTFGRKINQMNNRLLRFVVVAAFCIKPTLGSVGFSSILYQFASANENHECQNTYDIMYYKICSRFPKPNRNQYLNHSKGDLLSTRAISPGRWVSNFFF